jgi:hypothetical protein
VNGDGYGDVIVGADLYDNPETNEGMAFVYVGSASGLSTSAAWSGDGGGDSLGWPRYGYSVATAGDVDGNGIDEILVGAPQHSNDQGAEGRAYLYSNAVCTEVGAGYCAANANSTGTPAEIGAWCSANVSDGSLSLIAAPVPDQFGVFFHGATQTQAVFGNGYLCITDDLVRGIVTHAWDQSASYRYDNSDAEHGLGAYVGMTRHFQYWFRDPVAGGAFFNTSDAISIAVLP